MSRGLTALLVVALLGVSAPAWAQKSDAPRGASSTKIRWTLSPQVELGGMLFNSAAGDHTLTGFVGARGSFRPNYLLTLSGGYGLGIVSQGNNDVSYLNFNHRVYGRGDLAWGTADRQFYVGAGPGVFANQFSVTSDDNDYSGVIFGIGAVYAVGYRWALFKGRIAAGIEFGGQFHHERNDFLVTFVVGPGLKL